MWAVEKWLEGNGARTEAVGGGTETIHKGGWGGGVGAGMHWKGGGYPPHHRPTTEPTTKVLCQTPPPPGEGAGERESGGQGGNQETGWGGLRLQSRVANAFCTTSGGGLGWVGLGWVG